MKRIVILGGGRLSYGVYKSLSCSGEFHTICFDKNLYAPCRSVANEFHQVDISDWERVVEKSIELDIDGIMPINEFGVLSAAYASHVLNLHGNSIQTALLATNKLSMRYRWESIPISQPRFSKFINKSELETALKYVKYPAVIKPAESGGGGRGVSIVRSDDDLLWAYNFAKPYAKSGNCLVEQYIEGTELTVESFSDNGKVTVITMSDKIKPDVKTRVATRLTYPANLLDCVRDNVENLVISAVKSLGIQTGMAHTEVIVSNDGTPYLIETAARGGGGHIFHTIIDKTCGFNAVLQTANILTGLPVNIDKPRNPIGVVYGFFTPPPGILKATYNLILAFANPGVVDLGILKTPGERIGSFENSLERCGYFVTSGKTREDATAIADWVENTVKFDVIGD